jgi:hypothetical protein
MRLWLIVLGCLLAPATASQAQMLTGKPLIPRDGLRSRAVRPNLRLVQQPPFDPAPTRQSGMIISTQVTPDSSIGLGLFNVTPKKLNGADYRIDGRTPRSRKVGVSFRMRF